MSRPVKTASAYHGTNTDRRTRRHPIAANRVARGRIEKGPPPGGVTERGALPTAPSSAKALSQHRQDEINDPLGGKPFRGPSTDDRAVETLRLMKDVDEMSQDRRIHVFGDALPTGGATSWPVSPCWTKDAPVRTPTAGHPAKRISWGASGPWSSSEMYMQARERRKHREGSA